MGNAEAFHFPIPSLHKGDHRYDVSYSGLKTAVVNQLDQFHTPGYEKSHENIAASFEKAAVDMLVSRVFRAAKDTGLTRIVAGGGAQTRTRCWAKRVHGHFPTTRTLHRQRSHGGRYRLPAYCSRRSQRA
ncbi:MAG: hypothetical protein ABR590_04790 [Spirochaetia bacterium]